MVFSLKVCALRPTHSLWPNNSSKRNKCITFLITRILSMSSTRLEKNVSIHNHAFFDLPYCQNRSAIAWWPVFILDPEYMKTRALVCIQSGLLSVCSEDNTMQSCRGVGGWETSLHGGGGSGTAAGWRSPCQGKQTIIRYHCIHLLN